METSEDNKSQVEKLTIQAMKTTWVTFGNGKLGAYMDIIGLRKTDQDVLDKSNLSSVLLTSVPFIDKHGIYPLSVHDVELSLENGSMDFKKLVTGASKVARPSTCPSCSRALELKQGELWCRNPYCQANSRACLRLMIRGKSEFCSLDQVDAFLDNYLVDGAPTSINNLFEFSQFFFRIRDKNTTSRLNQWKEQNGKIGETYWRIEVAFQNALSRKSITAKEFWEVCNFPGKVRMGVNAWRDLSPKEFLEGSQEIKAWFHAADKHTRDVLVNNLDFINLLFKVYTENGEVEWI